MLALSFRGFVRDKFNIFDTLVVLSSIVELNLESGSGSSLGALRAVRLFRIFKIFRVGDLRVLMDSIGSTVMGMGNYTVLLLLFIYLYNLLGMQFFAGKFSFDDDGLYSPTGIVPRENFDTIWEAFITIVIIMIGDGWNSIMYYAMLSCGKGFCIYFVTLYAFGNVIMLNLFLAILLGNFDESRQFMAKQKAFEEFKRLHKKNTPLPIALTLVLGDLGDYIVDNIIGDRCVTFIKDIEEANIPDQNEPRASESQRKRNEKEDQVKVYPSEVYENEKSNPHMSSKNNQDTIRGKQFNENDDAMYHSFGQSHESIDKLFNDTSYKKTYHSKNTAGNIFFQEQPVMVTETKNDIVLPDISRRKIDMFREFPANQQEGDAYDQSLNDKNSAKDISNPEIAEIEQLSQILNNEDESKIEHDDDDEEEEKDKFQYLDKRRSAKIDRERNKEDEESDRFDYDEATELKNRSTFLKIWKYLNHSSLFIFHDSWKFRECLLLLVISTENLTHKQPKVRKRNSLAVSSSKRQDIEEIARVVNERESQNEEAQNEGENQNEEENLNDEVSDNESMKTHTESSNSFDENFESNPYISQVYQLNDLKIVNNKIVTTKQNIKYSAWFEYFIITVIILNSLALILDNPLQDPNGPLSKTLKYLDIIFTIIFTIEACMKIIALGFFWNNFPGISGYILNGWNMLDFVIVCASLVDLGFSLSSSSQNTGNLKSLKALRAFRALRPLRVISRNEGLQIVVNTLFASVPAMTNVFMVMILLLIIFSIMGVNFFKGEFYQCTFDDSYTASQVKAILERVIHKDDCIAEGGSWVNSDQNFDNVFVSLLTLFQMMSTEGWTNVMYNGMDSKGVNLQPKQNNGPWYSIYFILFMIVGFLFLMNLFVGVIIDNFNKIKEQKDVGGIFVTDSQRNWIEIQHLMLAKTLLRKKYPPQGKFRRFFYDVQDSKYFEGFIITCIFMNTIIMAMQYARMDHDYGLSIEAINYVFSFIFNVEMVIKLIAL